MDLVEGYQYIVPTLDHPWHHECTVTFRYVDKKTGVRAFWCPMHGQWTYQFPVKVEFMHDDSGTIAVS